MEKSTQAMQDALCEIIWDIGKKLDIEHLKKIRGMIDLHLEIKTKG
jgi:hypothetical protein